MGDSQFSGIARITDNGDGTSAVSVSITQFGAAGMMGDDMAAEDMAAEDMAADDMAAEDMDDENMEGDDTDA